MKIHYNFDQSRQGFTIVELLIVIVVIAILAAISVVAYNGIQQRARDSERTTEMATLQKALALYFVDNDGYPRCHANGTYIPTSTTEGCTFSSAYMIAALVPKYIPAVVVDPINTGSYQYWYAVGYRKTGTNTYTGNASNNYIVGAKLESKGGPFNPGWTGQNDLNYLEGSNN